MGHTFHQAAISGENVGKIIDSLATAMIVAGRQMRLRQCGMPGRISVETMPNWTSSS